MRCEGRDVEKVCARNGVRKQHEKVYDKIISQRVLKGLLYAVSQHLFDDRLHVPMSFLHVTHHSDGHTATFPFRYGCREICHRGN